MMNLRNWSQTACKAAGKSATLSVALLGLLALCFAFSPTDALAKGECNSNGKCCDELNAFWKEKVYHQKLSEMLDPHPLSRDFVALDSSKYPWPEKLSCPSIYSRVADGLKLLYDFSHSGSSERNYYESAKSVLREAEYALVFTEGGGSFAAASSAMRVIKFSALNSTRETPPRIAATIVHEIFHVINYSSHVTCKRGQNIGKDTCDEELQQKYSMATGAYTAHILFLHDLIRSGSFPVHNPSAQSMLNTLIKNQINTLPKYGPDGVTPFMRYYGVK